VEHDFWHERWATQQIGFHLDHPNPLLVKHASVLPDGARVLVPLCGKAIDLRWLAERGHAVVGVELSELAVRSFFAEQQLEAEESRLGPFQRFVAGNIEILCGDFFALEPALLGSIGAVYDRAALIALPEAMRARYAAHVLQLVPDAVCALLITLEHTGNAEVGPPFSVSSAEVHALYGAHRAITELERTDVLPSEPRFKARNIPALYEVAYALRKR
jgi:thiopurine S-methyltransferase